MIPLPFALFLGFTGGLIRANQGAYKDSPWEDFELIKYVRSLFFGTLGGLVWYIFSVTTMTPIPAVIFLPLTIFFDSVCTEGYKRGIRVEDLSKYKMPTIFHINGKIVKNPLARLGIVFLFAAFLIFWFGFVAKIYQFFGLASFHPQLQGILMGLLAGSMVAIGGSLLDVAWEGFNLLKFFRSIYVGAYWGLIFSFYTINPSLLVFACLGMDRMSIEFYKSFLRKIKSGKFKSDKPTVKKWLEVREKLLPIYTFGWLVFVYLLVTSR